jgi:hypothetical protein
VTDILDLICDLIEQPSRQIGASLRRVDDDAAKRLAAAGLAQPGAAPKTIACRACDEDHAATPQFDSATARYFHFCPVAGRVEIEPRALETLEIRPRAMVNLLMAAFPVLPAIGRELVNGSVWHLGEAVICKTSLTLILACRIRSLRAFDELAAAVGSVPATEIGMIVATGALPIAQGRLPDRYIVVGLREIAGMKGDGVEINRQRLAAYIRMQRCDRAGRNAGGRPSQQDRIAEAYRRRRQSRKPFESIAAEARAIIADLAAAHADRKVPGGSTVRRHLGKLRSTKP